MNNQFSQRVSDIIVYSKEEANRLRSRYIGPEHLLLGMLRDGEGKAIEILSKLNTNLAAIKQQIEAQLKAEADDMLLPDTEVPLSNDAAKILKMCILEARGMKSNIADTEHVLLAILREKNNMAASVLESNNVNYVKVLEQATLQPDINSGMGFTEDDDDEEEQEACRWQISDEEYAGWQKEIRQIKVSAEVLSCITEIRKNLEKVEIQGSEVHRNVYVSDRRWKNIVKLLKASAFIHGRKEVCLTDLLPVYHCLWNEPEECADIRQIVVRALFVPYVKEIAAINLSLKSDLKVSRVREALEKARQKGDRRDDDLMIIDHFYYQIENHGTGNTYIFIVDYKNLKEYSPKDVPATGVMYADPLNPKRTIIRTFSDATKMKEQGAERVTLYRDEKNLYINGVRFPMRRLKRGEQQQLWLGNMTLTDRDYETELETAHGRIEKLVKDLSENIFISEEDKKGVAQYVATLRKEIAWARVDVRKLRYGDES